MKRASGPLPRRISGQLSRRICGQLSRQASGLVSARWAARSRVRGDVGLAALELVVMTPFIVVMMLTVVGFGRYAHGKQIADQSASAAARAASLANTPAGAATAARSAAKEILDNAGISCDQFLISPDTSQFRSGGKVSVTISCSASLSGLSLAGLPGHATLTSTATAAIETYRDLPQ